MCTVTDWSNQLQRPRWVRKGARICQRRDGSAISYAIQYIHTSLFLFMLLGPLLILPHRLLVFIDSADTRGTPAVTKDELITISRSCEIGQMWELDRRSAKASYIAFRSFGVLPLMLCLDGYTPLGRTASKTVNTFYTDCRHRPRHRCLRRMYK